MLEWFKTARSQGIPLSGPMLQEKALFYASELGVTDLKASNGWLGRFRERHNINFAAVCGESNSVNQVTVDDWVERLPTILAGYDLCDVFNMDETGLFFRALPDKSLSIKGEDCKGGKRSKERLTVALCCNAVGDFEKPLMIGKAATPRCFRNTDVSRLPVMWRHNKKAWMTRALFTEWVQLFNQRMRRARRNVLLLLDNAPSHPPDLQLTNVKIVFLPANTTSKLQPLDQGIIQNMKQLYRKRLLRSVLSKINKESMSAVELSKCVSVLDAVQWVHSSVNEIKRETVSGCFKKSGVHFDDSDNLPLSELSDNMSLSELRDMLRTAQTDLKLENAMSAEEFEAIDSNIPVHSDLSENWEKELMETVLKPVSVTDPQIVQEEKEELQPEQTELKINSYQDALHWLAQIRLFCYSKDMATEAFECGRLQESLDNQAVKVKSSAKQTRIDSFFK
ncbi:tigger transposable element-derived protein 6-like [Dreissena polymorpha]|uniref:tigger transposable element-derived protein 6-like n=1 Tax=Dreissena polymorpha TaxID=45954 RepID=UPI0022642FB3|nr:tigger transposable element-derived protein 6-like [Dreissena polymorpha]